MVWTVNLPDRVCKNFHEKINLHAEFDSKMTISKGGEEIELAFELKKREVKFKVRFQ